jgi:alpha/beta superfamily hydrolase
VQQITINNRDDLRLSALLSFPADPRCLIIACHGFRGAKENGGRIYSLGDKLSQIGMALLAFDFQGSGQSEGQYSNLTLTRQASDLQDVINYAHRKYQLPIIVLGRSFGGSTVLAGASQDSRIAGYIFWSTTIFLKETFTGLDPVLADQLEKGNTIILTDEKGNYKLDPDLFQDFANHMETKIINNANIFCAGYTNKPYANNVTINIFDRLISCVIDGSHHISFA